MSIRRDTRRDTRRQQPTSCSLNANIKSRFQQRPINGIRRASTIYCSMVAIPVFMLGQFAGGAPPRTVDAKRLADLPDSLGVAAPYVGVAGGALIVAGGTNFPDAPPWKGGTKTWHDDVYVLPSPSDKWQRGFKLPHRMAYGISLTTNDGILCIGGCDEKSNLDNVLVLQWDGNALSQRDLPSLPRPTSCAAGALVGSQVFVAGGQAGPDPASGPSHSNFWMLDLDASDPVWRELPTWPGPERFYCVGGTDGKSFFMLSGIRRVIDGEGKPTLEYLNDAFRFDPLSKKWDRMTELPHPNAAVASPAPYISGALVLLGQGADGSGVNLPLGERKPFGREALRFDIGTGKTESVGTLPFGVAAAGTTLWDGSIIVASGEIGPGVRSPAVWVIDQRSLEASP
jgi:N-acetylneuraminic acid mutarotase